MEVAREDALVYNAIGFCRIEIQKKRGGKLTHLHAGQPINTDFAAGGVTPELNELLDREDTGQVLDRSAIFGMASF